MTPETTEHIRQFADQLTKTDIVVTCIGISVFIYWLTRTHFGTKALTHSRPRRNNMLAFMPLIPLLVVFGIAPLAVTITEKLLTSRPEWQLAFANTLILCCAAITGAVVTLVLAHKFFSRRLKGFGLDAKTIPEDAVFAAVNLITILPLVALAVLLTAAIGRFFVGPEFQITQHKELESIIAHPQLPVKIIIVITAVVAAPVFEEMLFRGMFQSLLRSNLQRPWTAIIASSALFAIVHADSSHWPALFVLAICLGYSYEKSGSLFRPIFIHALFNALAVTAALTQ